MALALQAQPVEVTEGLDANEGEKLYDLAHLGYLEKSFEWMGNSFTLHTLRSGEEVHAINLVKEYQDNEIAYSRALMIATVASALDMVNGQPLVAALGPDDNPRAILALKYNKVAKWFTPTVEELYRQHVELEKERNALFEKLRQELLT